MSVAVDMAAVLADAETIKADYLAVIERREANRELGRLAIKAGAASAEQHAAFDVIYPPRSKRSAADRIASLEADLKAAKDKAKSGK